LTASSIQDFSNALSTAAESAGKSVVAVHGRHRMPSSGTHWQRGIIVTANHTVRVEDEITILIDEKQRATARLVGRDTGTDLAVLKLDTDIDLPVADQGSTDGLRIAQLVIALGRTRRGTLAASAGIIGGVGGEFRTWHGSRLDPHIRLSLELYPGFSGGPLAGADGKVLGINTSGLGRGRPLTIPAATVSRSVQQLLEKGYIARPYLGVALQPVRLPDDVRGKLNSDSAAGLIVMHVEEDGPAAASGIVLGDVIVELNQKPVRHMHSVQELLGSAQVGDKVSARVLRAGALTQLDIVLGERKPR
jgi:S1-C subfamily serine protease